MKRAIIFVMDSVGIGGAKDSIKFGDKGANTLGHIAQQCALGKADRKNFRKGPLFIPNMISLGLAKAMHIAEDNTPPGLFESSHTETIGFYGAAQEISSGKDTPSGHWEIAGAPILFQWGYFPQKIPSMPRSLINKIIKESAISGILANKHASGTQVIEEFGEEHITTGKPIFYTSADSVLQIAAHEEYFGLKRLYSLCEIARRHVDLLKICRVIARPFTGEKRGKFKRTPNRRDYTMAPPLPTLLDLIVKNGGKVFSIGKIGDIFAHRNTGEIRKAANNMEMFDVALKAISEAGDGDLVFANFIDFDSLFGHRRDVIGYARALEMFDARIPEALGILQKGDLFIITADHGNDPTWHGSDHTRECIPIIGAGEDFKSASIGMRSTFADISATICEHLSLEAGKYGHSFYEMIHPKTVKWTPLRASRHGASFSGDNDF